MNLPNKLTILRILLTFVFMFFLFLRGVSFKILALLVFVLASLTDMLDGYIAKRNNMITDFGKLMDPIADKILVIAAFLAFIELNIIPAWMAVIVMFRELVITGFRILALSKKKVLSADEAGKHKMVSQVIAILAVLVFLILKEGGAGVFGFWNQKVETLYREVIFGFMIVTVSLTIVSGVAYFIDNRDLYININTK